MAKSANRKSPKDAQRSSKAISDPRFSSIQTDPRFRLPSKKHARVEIDKRFAHMLRDGEFSRKSNVDKYGRKMPKQQGKKDLEKFYRLEEDEEDVDDDEDVQRELKRLGGKTYDPARDGGFSESEDDSSSSSDDEVGQGEEDATIGGQEEDVREDIPMGEVSSRIAIVNMDWDNLRAVDIMAVASSLCPPAGKVLKCSIYPSEFGKERMEREEQEGPAPELFTNGKKSATTTMRTDNPTDGTDSDSALESSDGDSSEVDEEEIKAELIKTSTAPQPEIDSHALRNYQLSRLRYFYAVLDCSSADTAQALYDAMDGREYLSTANFFDMRFVPDDVEFDDDRPRDECSVVPDGYKPNEFVTEALTHSRVKLTWDEDDRTRKEAQKRAFTASRGDFDENDLAAYVGSDSSDEEADAENTSLVVDSTLAPNGSNEPVPEPRLSKAEAARRKMREALGLSDDNPSSLKPSRAPKASKENDTGSMQITFSSALSSKPTTTSSTSVFENRPSDVQEETTRERYIRKERERKARRKERAKGTRASEDAEPATLVTNKNEAEEKEKADADPFADPFFTDPSSTNAASRKEARRVKRQERAEEAQRTAAANEKQRAELELLLADEAEGKGEGFDMAAVRKAEKNAARKGKKGKKLTKDTQEGDGAGGEFELDVADPRFKDVYERHEFAIDPSHARFSGTRAMNALLEEGRRRRAEQKVDEGEKKGKRDAVAGRVDGEVDELLKRVKRRRI